MKRPSESIYPKTTQGAPTMLKRLTLILCMVVTLSFAELPLVKNGVGVAEIVVPDNSIAPVVYAS